MINNLVLFTPVMHVTSTDTNQTYSAYADAENNTLISTIRLIMLKMVEGFLNHPRPIADYQNYELRARSLARLLASARSLVRFFSLSEEITTNQICKHVDFQTVMTYRFELMPLYSFSRRI